MGLLAMRSRPWFLWVFLVALLALIAAWSLFSSSAVTSQSTWEEVVLPLRAWRLGNAMLAGAALAVAGVVVQGLFRNPLASPSILGTTAGAHLGGLTILMLWQAGGGMAWGIPAELILALGCVLGALLSLVILLVFVGRRFSSVSLLLVGFILSSLFMSIGALWVSLAQDQFELGRAMVAFTLGGVEAKGARHFLLAAPLVVVATFMAWAWGRHLDLLLSGEDQARSLGLELFDLTIWAVVWAAVLCAAAVAVGGNIAFVGLVVPHLLRPFVGVGHRPLVLAAALGGAIFLSGADLLSRAAGASFPLPLGVVTSLVGAPVFLWILIQQRRMEMSP